MKIRGECRRKERTMNANEAENLIEPLQAQLAAQPEKEEGV